MSMANRIDGSHTCPKMGCNVIVPNRLYACLPHWMALSQGTRIIIIHTSRLPPLNPQRRAAFRQAEAEWGDAPWPIG